MQNKKSRLIAQLKLLKKNPSKYYKLISQEGQFWKFEVYCDEFPYKGQTIILSFQIPFDYPYEEPQAKVQRPGLFMHPNIDQNGIICYYSDMKPGSALQIVDRITIIMDLLSNPNAKNTFSPQNTQLYLKNPQQWRYQSTKKYESNK